MGKPSNRRLMFNAFMSDTTIHGCRYIIDRSFNRIANCVWLLVEICAFSLGIYMIMFAFQSWEDNPVLTTVDTVAHPLKKELYPTITFCAKAKQPKFDAWGMVTTGVNLIEEACSPQNISKQPAGICSKYEPHIQNLKQIAINVIGNGIEDNFAQLQMGQIVRLTAAIMEDFEQKTEYLLDFYKELAKVFGDPEGRFTPMASLYLTIYGSKKNRLESHLISGLLLDDERCNDEDMEGYIEVWKTWLKKDPPLPKQPCLESYSAGKCCGYFASLIKRHFNMSTLAMSYAIPHFRTNHLALLGYLGLNDTKGLKYKAPIYNIVPACQVPGGSKLEACVGHNARALEMVYSSRGICIGFNTPTTEDMYKETKWLDHFNDVLMRGWGPAYPINVPGAGSKFKMVMIYTDQLVKFDYPFVEEESSSIYFMPNQFNSSHSILWDKISAKQGMFNDLVLVPTIVGANDQLIDIPAEKRKCLFDSEGNQASAMFTMHTQESCGFECMLKRAVEICGYCIPWNMPQVSTLIPDNVEPQICDLFEADCFDMVFDDGLYRAENCTDCYPGCKTTILEYKRHKEVEDVSYCDDDESEEYRYAQEKVESANLQPILEVMMNITNITSGVNEDLVSLLKTAAFNGNISGICKYMMRNHWTTAKFELASANAIRLYQDVKVTFPDKIATFGGTMGLFTGMSLLSVLEVLF